MSRPSRKRRSRINSILIICQGKTEETYFQSFPVVQANKEWSIRVQVESHALDPLQLVEKAIEMSSKGPQPYNTVWCVFDKDDFKKNFKDGVRKADAANIRTAFSIESFELWLLLHFQKVSIDSPLDRKGYIEALDTPGRLPGYCKDGAWQQDNIRYKQFNKPQRDKALEYSKDLEKNSKKAVRNTRNKTAPSTR